MRRVPSTLVSYIDCHSVRRHWNGVEPEGAAGIVDQQSAPTDLPQKIVHGCQIGHVERQRTGSRSEL